METTTKKRIARTIGATVASAALVAGGIQATPAQAIQRMGCVYHTLNLVSSNTTCWGNAGYASVTLYGVYTIVSGNNAGYVQGSGGTTYFSKWQSKRIATQTISGIRIY